MLLDVFDSDQFTSTFLAALDGTHDDLIAAAELESAELLRNKGEVFFDMRALYRPIYDGLRADDRTSEITQSEVPPGYGVFKVADRETTINFLWTLLRNGPNWAGLTMAGAILAFIGAVLVADRRPSTVIQFGGGMAGLGIVLLVIIYLIRFLVPLLAGGGSEANPVVAVYAANLAPLVGTMIRFVIMGVVLAAIGGVTRYIWPDDWVYSSVSDERGVRSIRRRRGEPDPAAQAPVAQRPAAMAPGYGYAQPPYPGYAPGWGGYPAQQYGPGYGAPYPAGPYAQPAQPLPQHYQSPGKPTVPVMPVQVDDELVPPDPPPVDAKPGDLPADAAQVVPRVVATTDSTLGDAVAKRSQDSKAKLTVVDSADDTGDTDHEPHTFAEQTATDDEWAAEKDW